MNNDYIYIIYIYIYMWDFCVEVAEICRGGVCDLAYSSFVNKNAYDMCVYDIYIYIHMYIHTLGQFFDFWFRKSDCRRCDCRVGSSLGMHFPPHAA